VRCALAERLVALDCLRPYVEDTTTGILICRGYVSLSYVFIFTSIVLLTIVPMSLISYNLLCSCDVSDFQAVTFDIYTDTAVFQAAVLPVGIS